MTMAPVNSQTAGTAGHSTTLEPASDRWFENILDASREPELLGRLRTEAWRRYRELPLPTRRSEEWRYTDIGWMAPEGYRCGSAAGDRGDGAGTALPASVQAVLDRSGERSGVCVLHDGVDIHCRLAPELESLGVRLSTIADAARDGGDFLSRYLCSSDVAAMEQKLWSLHVAALTGGYLLYVPAGVRLEHPVHVFHILDSGGSLAATHSLLIAAPGAEVSCVDEFISPDLDTPSLSLSGVEIFAEQNASVKYVSLQRYGRGIRHFSMQHIAAGRDARVGGYNVALGADVHRADVTSRLVGPGSQSDMLALWFGDRDRHVDHHTLQHHEADHARSDLLYKGALTDSAFSVFRGLIRVDPGAQLTDAYQTNRNLLLSEESRAISLPNLEIEADDVRCSHGATIGQTDAAQIFYLMSRGLDRARAEKLLVLGFFDEVLNRLPLEGIRERVREAIQERIGA